MSYVIGSFNVRNLNYKTEKNGKNENSITRAYEDLGYIIQENFDIVALQEVLNEQVLKKMFNVASGWKYCWKQSRSKSDNSNEGFAFAWNSRRFRPVAEPDIWEQYKQDPELGKRGLLRNPYYGRFTPLGTAAGGPFCEIRLLNTHIRFSPQKSTESKDGIADLRRRELQILTQQILHRLKSKRYGNNLPAYTFLMGDYNLELKRPGYHGPYLEEFITVEDLQGDSVYSTVQDKRTTIGKVNLQDKAGNRHTEYKGFSHNYDHFTFDAEELNRRGINAVPDILDTVQEYRNGDFERHFLELSDHIPIMLKIDLK